MATRSDIDGPVRIHVIGEAAEAEGKCIFECELDLASCALEVGSIVNASLHPVFVGAAYHAIRIFVLPVKNAARVDVMVTS